MMVSDYAYQIPQAVDGTILQTIVEAKLHEIAGARLKWPAAAIEAVLDRAPEVRSLKQALLRDQPAIIAELKKASPSAGVLRTDFKPIRIGQELQKAGAAALSVITEVRHFQGGLENLASVRWRTQIPLLRKDFIIDPYQILEARHAGADAVLLIAALFDTSTLEEMRAGVERLGMEALVEVHNEAELDRAFEAGATLIGVNNRDLRTFEVTIETGLGLAARLPAGIVAVAESGLRGSEDIQRLWDAGYRGFLVGEQLMRAASPGEALRALLGDRSFNQRSRG